MIPRCKECQHCELRNRAENKFAEGYVALGLQILT